jgi:hypothetical protein
MLTTQRPVQRLVLMWLLCCRKQVSFTCLARSVPIVISKSLSINHVHGTTLKKRNYAIMHNLQGKRESSKFPAFVAHQVCKIHNNNMMPQFAQQQFKAAIKRGLKQLQYVVSVQGSWVAGIRYICLWFSVSLIDSTITT